jgi:capsular exopolysaccharide synthesis family protein
MQQRPQDPNGDQLPLPSDAGAARPLVIARNGPQALSIDLRGSDAREQDDEIDLLAYWQILVKRRWLVLSTLAMVLVIVFVNTLLTTPIYRATALLQIDANSVRVFQVEGLNQDAAAYDYNGEFLQTQMELLKSRALAQRVVVDMGLAESGELDRLWPPSPWTKIAQLLRGGERPSTGAKSTGAGKGGASVDALAGSFQGGVSVEPVENSRLIRVNYDSPDAKFSQRAANAVAQAFMASNIERRFDSASYAKSYLEDRLQELKLKLEDSERKLVDFAQKEQIVQSGGENVGSLSQQNLGSINTALAEVQRARIRAEARWRQAQALHGPALESAAGDSPVLGALRESRARLGAEYQDKLRLYKPAYPAMQQLKGQMDEVDRQIAAEEASLRSGLQAEYQAALAQEKMLSEQIAGLKGEVLDLQGRSIQYNILQRDVETNRQLYDGLLQRYKEIGVAGGVSANNISVVDPAQPGYRFAPSMRRNLSLAALFGALLGILLALAFEYFDDTFKRPDEIETQLGLAVLGAIPRLKPPMTPARAMEDVRSPFAEAYRSLRTALQFSTDHGVPRSLLITSAVPSEGKSTTALALARFYAQLGKRVLIVDCDLRNPTLHRALGVDNGQGLSNYLAGAIKPTDVVRSTEVPGLMYMPTGPLPPNPAELLMGPKMVSLLTIAAEKFDLLIMDGPPVMGLADAPILSNMAQGTLLVVRAGQTRIAVVKNALKRLAAARAHVVGGLLTQFQTEHAGYGYGYGDYGYYSYGGEDTRKLTRQ